MEMHELTKLAFTDELQKIASMHGEEISPEMLEALLKEAGLVDKSVSVGKNIVSKLRGRGGSAMEAEIAGSKAIPQIARSPVSSGAQLSVSPTSAAQRFVDPATAERIGGFASKGSPQAQAMLRELGGAAKGTR